MKRLRLDGFRYVVFELLGPTQRVLDALDLELPGGDLARRVSDLSGLGGRASMTRRHVAEDRRSALLRLRMDAAEAD